MNRKDLKVEKVQHYQYQNYFYVCLQFCWDRKLIVGVVSCVSCTYTAQRVPRVHNFENFANFTGKPEPEGLLTTRRTIQI